MIDVLKGNSTDFVHQSLITGVGEFYYICERSCMKPFVAPEGAVWSLMHCQHWLRLKTTSLKMKKIWGCRVREK